MKILHVLSNWKWTERAEPSVDLARAQQALGADVLFACDRAPDGQEGSAAQRAREKGLDHVVEAHLPKHLNVFTLLGDTRELRRMVETEKPDVVHCHMPNAHLLAARACQGPGRPRRVRSCYDPCGPDRGFRSTRLHRNHTDGLVVISQEAKRLACEAFALQQEEVVVAEPGLDVERFDPGRELSGARTDLRDGSDGFVVGMVTRIRQARRLDVVLEAVAKLAPEFPGLRLLVVGRGRAGAAQDRVERPARELGIRDRVKLAGYCAGDDLVAAYRAMDLLAYPVPGTDRSCRTVREAMAAGLPVLASATGFLPELVCDGETGGVVALSAGAFAERLRSWLNNRDGFAKMAETVQRVASERFSAGRQAKIVLDFYEEILKRTGQ